MAIIFSEDLFRGVDMNETLKLFHLKDESVKGLIYDHQNNPVVDNFAVPEELVLVDMPMDSVKQDQFPMNCYSAIEGTLIRVFYFNDEWNIATTSRIDAYTSFWSSKDSFGLQFERCVVNITDSPLDVFLNSLDVNTKYFFILPTTGTNRLGRLPDDIDSNFYLVGVEKDSKLICGIDLDTTEKNAWSYLEHFTINTAQELLDLVENKKVNLLTYESCHKIIKYISTDYAKLVMLRNNEQNLLYRYIELLKTDIASADELQRMYPEISFDATIDKKIWKIAKYIHTSYITRYIKKEYITIPKIFYYIMSKCHKNYLENRVKTTVREVEDVIMKEEPKIILSLIRNFSLKE